VGSENQGRRDVLKGLLGFVFSEPLAGTALLMRVADQRLLVAHGPETARQWFVQPGSTIKPLTLLALLEADKLKKSDGYLCPGKLFLNGHSLNCSHPRVALAMNVSRAIAYSCNCAVAHFAERFDPDELPRFLTRFGFSSVRSGAPRELQALGEEGVRVTAMELLAAYRRLANRSTEPGIAPIIEGLEGAIEFGTAQGARLDQIQVAGKTGSVQTEQGIRAAWFAGFAPSRAPEVAVTVLVQGQSGGADAAPVAGRILRNYFGTRS
jgi:cell division protein FtsI/penicillin-binding protein 2